MKALLKLFFIFSLSFILLHSCGSRDEQFIKVDEDILNALREKQQRECLVQNSTNITKLKNKTQSIFQNAKVGNFWEVTYNRDNTDSDVDDTSRVVSIYISDTNGDNENKTLTFLVINENGNDTNDNSDQKEFIYNQENQRDHIQLLAIEACSGDNVTFSENRIQFQLTDTNQNINYEINNTAPAFLGRFFSFISQIRTGDTDSQQGTINANITHVPRFQQSSTIPTKTSSIEDCTTSFPDISFDLQDKIETFPTNQADNFRTRLSFQTAAGIVGCLPST